MLPAKMQASHRGSLAMNRMRFNHCWVSTRMSIIGAFRRKAKPQDQALFMAMIALAEPVLPDVKQLADCFRQHWTDKPRFTSVMHNRGAVSCEIGPAVGAIGLMPTVIPECDILAACTASIIRWPEAKQEMRKHKAHLVCTVAGPVDKKIAAYYLTKLVAGTCKVIPVVGVYWGAATMVHSPEAFFEQADEMSTEYLPLYLWIHFGLAGSPGNISLRTNGMSSLGFMEIEIVDSANPPGEVVGFTFNVAHYLLDNGPVLADGNTFGLSAEQKVLVRHLPSFVDPKETVYRLSY